MSSTFLVPVALILFVPATLLAVFFLGRGRGAMAALLGGWMFLPVFDGRLDVPVLSTKMTFVSATILLVSLATDLQRWFRLRLGWSDLPAVTLFLGPFATAIANDLGPWEGISALVQAFCAWVAPYLLGRLYFGSPRAIRDLAIWTVGAALIYVPLCLWEIRMSPQLHRQLYGYHTFESFAFSVRFGGYRPNVFMQFGLMVGTFMATGALVAYWLWRSRAAPRIAGFPMGWCAAALVATTVLVKSTAAIVLMFVGITVLEISRLLRGPSLMLALTLLPVAFCTARIAGWEADEIVEAAGLISGERAQSIAYRVANEELLLRKALERPGLGWGRWGRSRVYDEEGRDLTVTDSLWIILFGTTGLVGLAAMGLLLLLPGLLLLWRFPARRWGRPTAGPAAAVALATVLWAVDGLLNSMTSPVFPAFAGAIVTFATGRWAVRSRAAAQTPRGRSRSGAPGREDPADSSGPHRAPSVETP